MPLPLAKYAVVPTHPPIAKLRKVDAAQERAKELRLKDKIDRANAVLDRLDGRQSDLAAAIKELQAAKAIYAKRAERICDRILTEMEDAGLAQAAGIHTSFTKRPAPESVDIVNEKLIPAAYMRTKEISAPDKIAIKAALAKGGEVPGVRLTVRLSLIRK